MSLSYCVSRYGYQIPGRGKWVSMALKRPKKKSGSAKKKKNTPAPAYSPGDQEGGNSDAEDEDDVFYLFDINFG